MTVASHRVVQAPCGCVRGLEQDGVLRCLGIPYAAPPVGPLRLRSPRPLPPWSGTIDATRPGPACLQTLAGQQTWLNTPIDESSEDCLFLNLWSCDPSGCAPVLVWVHGGQTRNGHGAAPAFDGSALARLGVVVVTLNYRLGALGGLAHPELRDDETGLCANWGLQDKLVALAWVQRNVAAFGGDPHNVTLAGQSSGAANVALIAQHGLGVGQFARLIVQSPPLFRPPMFAELDAAAEYTEAFAASLEVPVAQLRQLDGARLQQAEQAFALSPALAARMGRPRTAPVCDGQLLRQWSFDAPPASVPVLASWTCSESDFWFRLRGADGSLISPQQAPQSAAELEQRCAVLMRQHYAFADPPSAALVVAAQGGTSDVEQAWRQVYTDLVFRAPILHWLGKHARAGVPAFGCEFAHPVPSADGGTPHAADVPFVFGTHGQPHFARTIGAAPTVARCSAAMMAAWVAFARHGDPGAAAGCEWPVFDVERRQLMRFDAAGCRAQAPARAPALECWPAYRP